MRTFISPIRSVLKVKKESGKMAAALIGIIIGLVTAVIGFVIVDQVIAQQAWNSTLSSTIAGYVVPIGLLGVLGAAAFLAAR